MKKVFCAQKENNLCGRVLFESVEKLGDNTVVAQAKKFEANTSNVKLSNPKFLAILFLCVILYWLFFTHGSIQTLQKSKTFKNFEVDEVFLSDKVFLTAKKAQVN